MPRSTKKVAAKKKPAARKKPATKKPAAKRPGAKKPARPDAAAEVLTKLPPGESEAAFQKFIGIARGHKGAVERYRGGALVMRANVQHAVDALRPREAEIARELPGLDRHALWSTPELALAVGFAARAAQLESPDASAVSALLPRIYELRDLLLTNAEGLARAGLFNRAEVDKIRMGRGHPDAAQDCIDLAALYRRRAAALRGKTPVTADHIREAAEVGAQALKLLKPARTKAAAAPRTAAQDRDLLYTLLVARHRDLRRAGMYFWVDEVDRYVPALLSRERPGRPRKGKEPAPAPGGDKPA